MALLDSNAYSRISVSHSYSLLTSILGTPIVICDQIMNNDIKTSNTLLHSVLIPTSAKWNVFKVTCVLGSPMLLAYSLPTAVLSKSLEENCLSVCQYIYLKFQHYYILNGSSKERKTCYSNVRRPLLSVCVCLSVSQCFTHYQ